MKTQDISLLRDFAEIEDPEDQALFVKNYNLMVGQLNRSLKAFPLRYLDGEISDVEIAAGAEIRISHLLKSIPKYRLILGQTGNGVITDVKTKWTQDYITLKNEGAVAVTLTIMIIRE